MSLFSLFVIRVTQTKQNKEKVADYLHEVHKPLARYRDDKDLEMMLKEKEREDDPMLAYMKQKKRKNRTSKQERKVRLVLLSRDIIFSCSYLTL